MKKFFKILFGTISIATLAAGAYYLYKNVINKDSSDDFDDFEDDLEQPQKEPEDTREYVPINLTPEDTKDDDKKQEETSAENENASEEEEDKGTDEEEI